VVSHAYINRNLGRVAPHSPVRRLFRRGALVGVEAILELLAVLIARVVGKHLAACGALEGLEASFALDGLRGGVLVSR
jgi:hypothetical protein